MAATLSSVPVYDYLVAQIGTDKAWRTCEEIAKALGDGGQDARETVAKSLWHLHKNAKLARRLRAGSSVRECMALVDDASVRKTTKRPEPDRVAIAAPAPRPVSESAPEPNETTKLTLADVVRKHTTPAVVESPMVVDSGPLSDIFGPIASDADVEASQPQITCGAEAPQEPDECTADAMQALRTCDANAMREGGGETPPPYAADATPDPLDMELVSVLALLRASHRVPINIRDIEKKLNVLNTISAFLPPLTRKIIRNVAEDLERVHGS